MQHSPGFWARIIHAGAIVSSKAEIFGALPPAFHSGFILRRRHIRHPDANVSSENTQDRIQAGRWVIAMCGEDELVSIGKQFNPIGWHAAHKTLPIGTLIRV